MFEFGVRLWGKAFSGRGTLSRRYTPMSRRWGESEAVLLGVREDWSYVTAARGWLGARTEPRCRLTPSSGLLRKQPGVACWEPGGRVVPSKWVWAYRVVGPAGGVEGGGLCRRNRCRETLRRTPPFPPPLSSASCTSHHGPQWQWRRQTSRFPGLLRGSPTPALITPWPWPWPWPHSLRSRASSTGRADSGAVPWDRKV